MKLLTPRALAVSQQILAAIETKVAAPLVRFPPARVKMLRELRFARRARFFCHLECSACENILCKIRLSRSICFSTVE
jgi:hypothetical protein